MFPAAQNRRVKQTNSETAGMPRDLAAPRILRLETEIGAFGADVQDDG